MDEAESETFPVVEDNPNDAFFIIRAFRTIPLCSAYVARNISEGRAYLAGAGLYQDRLNYPYPDGVLIGFTGGMESVQELVLSLRDAGSRIPVIVLTGGVPPAEVESLSRMGINEVIERPSSLAALRELLQRLVQDLCESVVPSSPDIPG